MKVAVLMSSYNGQKYIRDQIESILNQQDVKVDLYIRDDGSSDDTLNIIKEYKEITLYQGKNIGVGNSFMELLYSVPDKHFIIFICCDCTIPWWGMFNSHVV